MTDNAAKTGPTPLTRTDLKTMTPEAIIAAHENGELAHLTIEGKSRHLGLTN